MSLSTCASHRQHYGFVPRYKLQRFLKQRRRKAFPQSSPKNPYFCQDASILHDTECSSSRPSDHRGLSTRSSHFNSFECTTHFSSPPRALLPTPPSNLLSKKAIPSTARTIRLPNNRQSPTMAPRAPLDSRTNKIRTQTKLPSVKPLAPALPNQPTDKPINQLSALSTYGEMTTLHLGSRTQILLNSPAQSPK